jgi:protein arginine N-methyltransferase 1
MKYNQKVHGVVTWFNIVFGNLPNEVRFSTGPFADYTHWKQTVFYLNGHYNMKKGDVLKGSIACRKSKDNFRACDIKVSYHECPREKNFETFNKQVVQYKLR